MADILFVAHRVPWPPDKGEKIRAFNMIRHLSRSHRVHLAAFVDDPADLGRADELGRWCASMRLARIDRATRLQRMAMALLSGKALSVAVFDDAELRGWIRERIEAGIDLALGYSGAVAPVIDFTPTLFDLVDCDSAKWQAMARDRRGPSGWIYRREARIVARLERQIAERSAATLLVSEPEAELCRTITGVTDGRIQAVANGVDTELFDPGVPWPSPYPADRRPAIVFTGVMNYAPNVEAVQWLHRHVWPCLREHPKRPRLAIVGSSPVASIRTLADGDNVLVTGRVADIQPWLAHAAIAVAPLRLARGIQNKVLEAMAMELPVVATAAAAEGIDARPGDHFLVADEPADFTKALRNLLDQPQHARTIGRDARAQVIENHSWPARLAPLDDIIGQMMAEKSVSRRLRKDPGIVA
ncbi:MAG: TIGR03087 family PEP-CTERM/XrtA system glycosyltransferase [Geminicoccaceae bacterium]